ncbi:unnamed protein product [Nesidiocoris tenuis]|uniref:Uncharacterized protein n=1 Tax=Nesidiocoris tenuis TaxID=355587 RepID=A0A6H5GGY9_9HEMI|nr:unnamed protein product [Nesidiocoris tenuis]
MDWRSEKVVHNGQCHSDLTLESLAMLIWSSSEELEVDLTCVMLYQDTVRSHSPRWSST